MAVAVHIWGKGACFTRPEFKVERVSYDVITPSAARGILEAIYWTPAIRWHVDRLHVLKPIQFRTIRRNEVGTKANVANALKAMNRGTPQDLGIVAEDHRQQRAALVLQDVGYVIEAHFTLTDTTQPEVCAAKHAAIFKRRASRGQCFHRPYLGVREFDAEFVLLDDARPWPESFLTHANRDADLGWMLRDIDFANDDTACFFQACMRNGVIDVPPFAPVGG